MSHSLILGSASPRRKKIMAELGYSFEIVVPCIEEISAPDDPEHTVRDNALRKHRWCRQRHPESVILTADTIVVFEGRIIEKPLDIEQAKGFLRMFSGKTQHVLTAVAVSGPRGEPAVEVVESTVHFKHLPDEMIEEYFTRVNPLDKAGGYDVDQYGDLVIESYEGPYSNIMGLPGETAEKMLSTFQL